MNWNWRKRALATGALQAVALLHIFAAEPAAPPPDPIAVVRAQIEAFNRNEADALAARVAEDFVYYNVTSDATTVETKGRAALRDGMTAYFKSLPSVKSEVEGLLQTGPFVSFRERVSWTSPSGEKSQSALAIYEVHDGIITRAWYYPATP